MTPLFPLYSSLDYITLFNDIALYRDALGALTIAYIVFVKIKVNWRDKGLCFKTFNRGSFVRSYNYL